MILRYTLAEDGSGKIVIGCDEKVFSAAVAYAHDSLRDLLVGTLAILEGSSQVGIVFFIDEPGERYLNIRRLDREYIALQVVWYAGRRSKGEVRLSCESTLWELRYHVLASCEAIVENGGVEYRPGWPRHEFPLELLERLRAMDLRVRFERGQVMLDYCDQHVRMNASSLDSLLAATAALVEGRREATVSFYDDAGQHQLRLRRFDADSVALQAVWYRKPEEDDMDMGTPVFSCETRLERFRVQVLAAAGRN